MGRKSFSDRPTKSALAPVELATRRPDKVEVLPVSAIIADPTIQVRVGGLNHEWVDNFTVIIEAGGELEPIIVFRISDDLKVADGFHRLAASLQAGAETIRCIIKDGTHDDAKEYAESANLEHGLYLTNDDKKHILWRRLERQHDWLQFSNRQLAAILGVSHPTVGAWIEEFSSTGKNLPIDRTHTVGADGRTRKAKRKKTSDTPSWTPRRAKSRVFKITKTLSDDDLFSALSELDDHERDEVYGSLMDLYQRLRKLLED